MKHLNKNFKVLIMALTIIVLVAGNSLVYTQTINVTDKFGNELRAKSNPLTNSIKKIYKVNASISRFGVSLNQVTKSNVEELGKSIIKDYEDILDISSDDLKAISTRYRKSNWYLHFKQMYKDVPVFGSFVRYSIRDNGVVGTISADIHPDINLDVEPTISVSNAISTAIEAFEVDSTDTVIIREKPSLIVYPKIGKESVSYYLTFKVDLLSNTPSQNLLYLVDAHSGEIVEEINQRVDTDYSNDGNVSIRYWPQNPTDTSPVTYDTPSGYAIKTYAPGDVLKGSTTTDGNGDYDFEWTSWYMPHTIKSTYPATISNSYVKLVDTMIGTISWPFYPSTSGYTHDFVYTTEETNAFWHADNIHDWITSSPFSFTDMNYQMEVNLWQGTGTNGASDGTDIYFGTQGSQGWARSSDIIYHEYAHSIIHHIYDGNWIGVGTYTQSGAMNEGLPDYFAGTINDEARIGEYVGLESFRDLNETRTMTDYIYSGYDGNDQYRNGHIVAGAVWDMRESSSISDSEADELLFDALHEGPTDFDGLLDAILEEDDTDADLSNGTPHITDILYSFENHEIYSDDPDVPPAAPKNLSVSGGWLENPTLSWDANTEPDLDEYNIYRAAPEHSFIYEATTSNTSWVDTEVLLGPPLGLWRWYVKAVDDDDNVSNASNIASAWGVDKMIAEGREFGGIPTAFSLEQNYPNPFNPETKIQFGLPEDSNVKLEIFNIQGQIVATLVDGALSAGFHTATFDATSYPSGVYFYKIVAGNFSDIKRMLLVK